jgi:hypothetical protein
MESQENVLKVTVTVIKDNIGNHSEQPRLGI